MTTDIDLHPGVDQLRKTLGEIELGVLTNYTLADAIREGSSVTDKKENGWLGANGEACALSAALIACKARGRV